MITSFDAPRVGAFLSASGLGSGYLLRGLGPVVVLAGPNGSGKSRFLRELPNIVQYWKLSFDSYPEGVNDSLLARLLDSDVSALPPLVQQQNVGPRGDLRQLCPNFAHQVSCRLAITSDVAASRVNVLNLSYDLTTKIEDEGQHTGQAAKGLLAECDNPGFPSAFRAQHAFANKIARDLANATNRDADRFPQILERKAEADRFNALVRALLGVELDYEYDSDSNPRATLFGRPFSAHELSSGQKLLLAWCIVLHRQRQHLRDAIILIDEPENHLDPAACVSAIETLRSAILGEHGQIWLATHSIPLVSWAGTEALYGVGEGAISYRGNAVASVVDGLAGGANHRRRLSEFLNDSDRFGLYEFIAQCIVPPAVASHVSGDKQEASLTKLVSSLLRAGHPLRVLDYGAGKARLASALAREATLSKNASNLEYLAYEPHPDTNSSEMQAAVSRLNEYASSAAIVPELDALRTVARRVDLVVLCNVLHEIPADEWKHLFSQLQNVIHDTGSLVIVEDQYPPVGELPHQKGFLILNHSDVVTLFGNHSLIADISSQYSSDDPGRLTMFQVPREALTQINADTIRETLAKVRDRCAATLRGLRAGHGTQRDGRLHAHHAMMWVNAELALG